MRIIATSLAVVLLSASSIAIAQVRQGGLDGGGGPTIERGPGGPAGGGGAPAGELPGAGAIDRGGSPDGAGGAQGRAETSSQGPAERATEGRASKSERLGSPSERRQSDADRSGPSESRASKRDEDQRQERKASDESKPDKRERAADKSGDKSDKAEAASEAARRAQQSESNRSGGKNDAGDAAKRAETKGPADKPAKHVDLTDAKKDNLRGAFHKETNLKPRKKVDIDISIGRRLPRDWDYRPVPVAVIEIVPEYRDYVFVYAEDEYVICDPDTYEVVAVVPAGGDRYASAGSGSEHCPARLALSRDERELILDEVRMSDEVDVRDLEVGWSVPSDVELQRFPDRVVSEADELSACRYFVAKDQLAIVDPVEEKVVFVIDKG